MSGLPNGVFLLPIEPHLQILPSGVPPQRECSMPGLPHWMCYLSISHGVLSLPSQLLPQRHCPLPALPHGMQCLLLLHFMLSLHLGLLPQLSLMHPLLSAPLLSKSPELKMRSLSLRLPHLQRNDEMPHLRANRRAITRPHHRQMRSFGGIPLKPCAGLFFLPEWMRHMSNADRVHHLQNRLLLHSRQTVWQFLS